MAQLWLRTGNTACGGNVTAFFLDLWENPPSHLRLRGVRADSGFCLPELLALWESLRLPYVVVAQLSQPLPAPGARRLVLDRHGGGGSAYQAMSWPHRGGWCCCGTACVTRTVSERVKPASFDGCSRRVTP